MLNLRLDALNIGPEANIAAGDIIHSVGRGANASDDALNALNLGLHVDRAAAAVLTELTPPSYSKTS